MTLRHLRAGAVTLVPVGGLPGTGKTALAGALAVQLGFNCAQQRPNPQELAGVPAERHCAAAGAAVLDTNGAPLTPETLLLRFVVAASKTCEAISLRRYCPDQVLGVAF